LFIYGNLARAQMTQSEDEDARYSVPSSWELIRCAAGGQKEVMARSVLSFDLASDGSILHSDGASISRLTPDGRSERVLDAERVEQVLFL
jgi:hypothetical protein